MMIGQKVRVIVGHKRTMPGRVVGRHKTEPDMYYVRFGKHASYISRDMIDQVEFQEGSEAE